MKLRNKKTGEIESVSIDTFGVNEKDRRIGISVLDFNSPSDYRCIASYSSLAELNKEWEDYKPAEPLIKDEKIRKAVRAWAEAENCTSEMNLYYTLNRREKYITFHNPQTGSELQLCEFDSPVFQEMREYTIAELCGEEEE